MLRTLLATAVASAFMTMAAWADPIEGTYKSSETGETVKVSPCGAAYCMSYVTGPHKGKTAGTFKATGGGSYSGTITNLNDGGKKYKGKGKLSGKNLIASGCILGGIICKDVTYTRL